MSPPDATSSQSKWRTVQCESLRDVIELLDEINSADTDGAEFLARGQADADWRLRPSLMRTFSVWTTGEQARDIEKGAKEEFELCVPPEIHAVVPSTTDSLAWWLWMQNFGAPTRVLDWSRSPAVAAYFSVRDKWDTDGAVWLVKFKGTGVFSKITNNLEVKPFPNQPLLRQKPDGLYSGLKGKKLVTDADFTEPNAPHNLYFVRTQKPDARTIAQQSVHTVSTNVNCDHTDAIESSLRKNAILVKVSIPAESKCRILTQLDQMNVNSVTLFPGLDGAGRRTADRVALKMKLTEEPTGES